MARQHVGCALVALICLTQFAAGRRLLDGQEGGGAPTLPASALLGEATAGDAAAGAGSQRVEMKIINGENASSGDFDFMTALFMQGRFFCGGVLLDNTTVLTAAHCLVDTAIVGNPQSLMVWVSGTQYAVDKMFAHPGYSASKIPEDNKDLTFEGALHDIAVVKLATAVSGTPATVALASADTPVTESEKLQVAGWGTTENGQPSNILKFAEVDYLPPYRCPSDYDDVLCGGGTGQNTCNGDSGGPLLIRNPTTRAAAVLGVTSHGPDCLAGPNYQHGYYTDVRLYLDAIETWRQGKVYVWSPSSNTSASGTTPTPATPVAQPGDYQPSPVEWQPVPGWEDQWGSGWTGGNTGGSTPGSSGTTTNAGWSWQDVFCQVFGQC